MVFTAVNSDDLDGVAMPDVHHLNAVGEFKNPRWFALLESGLASRDPMIVRAAALNAVRLRRFDLGCAVAGAADSVPESVHKHVVAAAGVYLSAAGRGRALALSDDPTSGFLLTVMLVLDSFDADDYAIARDAFLHLAGHAGGNVGGAVAWSEALADAINVLAGALQDPAVLPNVGAADRERVSAGIRELKSRRDFRRLDRHARGELEMISAAVSL
ncbi:MAG TPA: hypothetical protein VEA69_18175 [Tepidisphaeraceae bacterium]|nr:hypothetical protein [Tepidisphaeraceae bacterium]